MSMINISNLTFAYEDSCDNIFENVSFRIDTDWRLGFVGRNGRGKTTFMKLLQEELEYSGTISSAVDFEYFPYEPVDRSALTTDVIHSVCPAAEDWEIYREFSLLKIPDDAMYREFSTLSSGEQTKALLAGMFLRQNAFMLIDEPTNHLDSDGRKILAEYLRRKKGFILISHDRSFLDACTDHTLSINKCNIELQKGSFSSWYANNEMRENFERTQNEKLSKDIKRLEAAAKRTAEWSDRAEKSKIGFDPSKVEKSISRRPYEGAKAKKLMSRSTAIAERRRSAVEEKSRLLKNIETAPELKLAPLKYHSDRLLSLSKISLSYGDKTVCSDIEFDVRQGDRIAICGRNGCGKSSVLKLICGESIDYSGELIKNNQLKISYVPQTTDHLSGSLADYADALGIDLSLFLAVLRKLGFARTQFEKHIEEFSGGQKKKVLIAGSLCEKAHLYVWDEPLNYIDVISRMQIENLILKRCPTLIFVEHDETFRNKISTKTVKL